MKKFSPNAAMDMVDAKVKLVHKYAVFEILRHVVVKSPVLSGTYKSNHKVNDPTVKVLDHNLSSGEAARVAMDEGEKQIAKIQTGYQVSTVSNALVYAGVIENGHSTQAALGVYRTAHDAIK